MHYWIIALLSLVSLFPACAQITFEGEGAGLPSGAVATPTPTPERVEPVIEARLVDLIPTLQVKSLVAALHFYTKKLGFRVALTSGKDYAAVVRDSVQIGLAQNTGFTNASRGSCYIHVSGIDALYKALGKEKVTFQKTIETQPSGMREFSLLDTGGNTLMFGEFVKQ